MYSTAVSRKKKKTYSPISKDPTKFGSAKKQIHQNATPQLIVNETKLTLRWTFFECIDYALWKGHYETVS